MDPGGTTKTAPAVAVAGFRAGIATRPRVLIASRARSTLILLERRRSAPGARNITRGLKILTGPVSAWPSRLTVRARPVVATARTRAVATARTNATTTLFRSLVSSKRNIKSRKRSIKRRRRSAAALEEVATPPPTAATPIPVESLGPAVVIRN